MNARFWGFGTNPPHCPCIGKRPATSMPYTCTNNLLSSPHTIVPHGTPETESPLLVFGFFDPHSSLSHTRSLTCTRFSGFCSVYITFCNLLHNNDNNTLSDKCGNEFNNYIRFLH